MLFDEDQSVAYDLSNAGHNLIVSGQGGTGKTFLIKQIIRNQREKGRHVSVVCSTGIAATLYGDLGAQTLHKWAGLEDGRHLNEEVVHLVQTDERFKTVKNNIKSTNLLIIDEVSMVSARTLGQVENLCRNVRSNDGYFGGIQVILSGDFYQLPPVQNKLIGDFGNYCFRLPWFNACFPHKIQLNIIHRQSEAALILCINELEKGEPSDETVAFLKSMDRSLPNEQNSVQLFARNLDVDMFNYNKLCDLPGESKTYRATDEGSDYYLRKFLAPKNLALKTGCSVMLVRNLNDSLVNGLCGTVTQLNLDSVDVKFLINDKLSTVTIKPVVFTTYDPVDKIYVAKRTQMPLKLAYAITVHKAQGMSLNNVVVNCEHCFSPGQIGVAVGRAQTVDGLRVKNFTKNLCRKHPNYVTEFYKHFTVGILNDDLSCCRGKIDKSPHNSDSEDDDDKDPVHEIDEQFSSESDFSDSEIEKLGILDKFVEENVLTANQASSLAKSTLDIVLNEFADTPMEDSTNSFKLLILENFNTYEEWFQSQYSVIEDIGLNTLPEGEKTFSSKQQSDFFKKFHRYLNSDEYINSTNTMLNCYYKDSSSCGPQYQFLTSLLFHLERHFFENLPTHLDLQDPEPIKNISTDDPLSSPARGKIRYISGYVLAKLKHNLSLKIRNSLFAEGADYKISKMQNEMNVLASLCSSYDSLKNSSNDPESLKETKRKQNERESLTNITDLCFEFFSMLEVIIREKLSHVNLVNHGKNLFGYVSEELLHNKELFDLWVQTLTNNYNIKYTSSEVENIDSIVQSITLSCESYIEIFHSAVHLFLKVSFSQFRRDYLTFLKKQKGKALRKKVVEKSKKAVKCFNMQFLKDDKSTEKQGSHLRLKSEIMQNQNFLSEKSFTKKDLLVLCSMYNIKISSQKRKDEISSALKNAILESDSIPCPEIFQTASVDVPSTSANTALASKAPLIEIIDSEMHVPGPSSAPSVSSIPADSLASEQPTMESTKKLQTRKRKVVRKNKGKGKGKGKSRKKTETVVSDSDEHCAVCNLAENKDNDEEWICCDACMLWYHRNCANLQDDEAWNILSEEGSIFTCPMCQ